jgi:non-heme chloroperoxidase
MLTLLLLPMVALIAAIVFGEPGDLPPMVSINDPFKRVDFSDLPPLLHFTALDGASLAYRKYSPPSASPRGSIVLVHGSSASSNSMHPMAKAFAQAGYVAYALDIRGHGDSGRKGQIAYIGQLEDDLEALMRAVSPPLPSTLAGFSTGGGFALRVAGSARQSMFQNYLFLSPFLSQNAPTYRPATGSWVSVGVPRIVGITMLNAVGLKAFNDLPVMRFALNEQAKAFLTPEYSFALASNFRPERDYAANVMAARGPRAIVAGAADELFFTEKFEPTIRSLGKSWPVTLLPGIGHIPLTLEPAALTAAVAAVERMRSNGT